MKGFLADYSTDDFRQFMNMELLFPCHMLVKGTMSAQDAHDAIAAGEMRLCRGYVESMAKSCKSPRDREFAEVVKSVKEAGLSSNSMSIFEFQKYHTIDIAIDAEVIE